MAYRSGLDWNPSLDPVVNPYRRIPCNKSIIGRPRVPMAFAVLSEAYNFGKTMSITSVEEGSNSEARNGWKSDIRVSRFLDGTTENFTMVSCKSLICLCGQGWSLICNPATRECQPLTTLRHERDGIGFGFDATKNQYKLVLLHLSSESTWCEIFTLGLNSWTKAKNYDPTMPTIKGKASYPTTIGESIYWITAPTVQILSFNVRTGKFISRDMYIQGKKILLENNIHNSLVEIQGSLYLVRHNGAEKKLDICTKNDVYEWKPVLSINLNTHFLPDHTLRGVTLVGFRGRKGYRGGKFLLWSTWKGLVSYDPMTQEFRQVYQASGSWSQTVVYTKSSTPLRDTSKRTCALHCTLLTNHNKLACIVYIYGS